MSIVQLKEELFVQCKYVVFLKMNILILCFRPSLQQSSCPGGCNVSNCFAYYFSYNTLPFPEEAESCPANCPVIREKLDENCMKLWGRCVRKVYSRLYNQVNKLNAINL